MKSYKIKLTALTPIHIGTGERYEPTNYVIDNGYLYEFDEFEFFKRLDKKAKIEFEKAAEDNSENSIFKIHRVISKYTNIAKDVAHTKVQVSKAIENYYKNRIGKPVQIEGGRRSSIKKVFNNFEIQKTIRFTNLNRRVYIPGSSLKGAISTAYQELVFKKDRKLWEELFENRNPSERIFKNLSVSDTKTIKSFSIIGYSLNKERFEDDDQGPKTIVETIFSNEKQQSLFETTLTFKDYVTDSGYKINFNELKKACNEHYLPIFEQMFKSYALFKGREVDDFTNEYFSDSFYEKYKNFKLKDNQFLIRVGKYSQARAVTIDGMREIRVKVSGGGPKRKPNRWETLDQETTIWLFGFNDKSNSNLLPFGWVLCELG